MKRLLLLLLVILNAACGPSEPVANEPVWGKQPCEHCAMLLSEKEHGAQVLTLDDDRLYFDDLGCLVAWLDAHPNATRAQWVRASDAQTWVPLAKAGFAPAKHTPMDFGFVATAKPGTVTWQQVTEAVRAKLRAK